MLTKILRLVTVLGVIGLLGFGVTNAFFSDTETSENNVFRAGKIDLKIDNSSYYNGEVNSSTSWSINDLTHQLFFNFEDLKPGDSGEDTISLHVEDNDAWVCMNITSTTDDDVSCTEPELEDDPECTEPNDNSGDGDIAKNIQFIFWPDDGDNVLEDDEHEGIFKQGTLEEAIDGQPFSLADAGGSVIGVDGPFRAGETYYIGKAWCFGDLTFLPVAAGHGVNPTVNSGILCDGSPVNNATQSDRAMMDFEFSAIQWRNNEAFTCSEV